MLAASTGRGASNPSRPAAALSRRRRRPQHHPALRIPELRVLHNFIPTCRCASRRCARSAPMPTCSRSRASWTSSRWRRAPTGRSSASAPRGPARPRVVKLAAERFGWARSAPGRAAASGTRATRTSPPIAPWPRGRGRPGPAASGSCAPLRRWTAASRQSRRPRNQIEGGILQSTSWTLYEKVAFDRSRIHAATGPSIQSCVRSVPDSVEVHIVDRPGEPFLGTARRRKARPRRPSAMPWRMRRRGGCATCRWISAAPRRWRRSIGPESLRSP